MGNRIAESRTDSGSTCATYAHLQQQASSGLLYTPTWNCGLSVALCFRSAHVVVNAEFQKKIILSLARDTHSYVLFIPGRISAAAWISVYIFYKCKKTVV